jgi:hypothetical protein
LTRGEQFAWAAGFFDGEGSTISCVNDKGRRMMISLGQKHPELVHKFRDIVGIGVVRLMPKVVMWQAWGYGDTCRCIELLWPYISSIKREQARKAIDDYLAYVVKNEKLIKHHLRPAYLGGDE